MENPLSGIAEFMHKHNNRKTVESFTIRGNWQEALDELNSAIKEEREAEHKKNAKKRAFWAVVEGDLKIYSDMRINEKEGKIEVLAEEDDE